MAIRDITTMKTNVTTTLADGQADMSITPARHRSLLVDLLDTLNDPASVTGWVRDATTSESGLLPAAVNTIDWTA